MKLTVIALMLVLAGCGGKKAPDTPPVLPEPEPEYTLEENIGMMLLVGFRGQEVDYDKNVEIISALRDYHVGSVILFDYDVPTVATSRMPGS